MAAAAWALIAFMVLEDSTEIITEPQGYFASLEACGMGSYARLAEARWP